MSDTGDVLDRATLAARHAALGAELGAALRRAEQLRGAVAILEELLALPDPPAALEAAA